MKPNLEDIVEFALFLALLAVIAGCWIATP